MLSIAYPNGHARGQAQRVMIDDTIRGTPHKEHIQRNTTERHYLRGKFLGTCSKGHAPRVMIKRQEARDTIEGQY